VAGKLTFANVIQTNVVLTRVTANSDDLCSSECVKLESDVDIVFVCCW